MPRQETGLWLPVCLHECVRASARCVNLLCVNRLSVTSDLHISTHMNMTELLMLWLAQSCPLPCWNVALAAIWVQDCGSKNNGKSLSHTSHTGRHTHTPHLHPHVENYFNCFVSTVPPEWERSWGLQFTRHICRCCISNWETQAARGNTHTNTDTQTEEYIASLSLPLTNTHCRCSSVQCFPPRRRAWKCWHIWASERAETENLLTAATLSIKHWL